MYVVIGLITISIQRVMCTKNLCRYMFDGGHSPFPTYLIHSFACYQSSIRRNCRRPYYHERFRTSPFNEDFTECENGCRGIGDVVCTDPGGGRMYSYLYVCTYIYVLQRNTDSQSVLQSSSSKFSWNSRMYSMYECKERVDEIDGGVRVCFWGVHEYRAD